MEGVGTPSAPCMLVVPVSGPVDGGGKVAPKDLILQLLELFLASGDIDD